MGVNSPNARIMSVSTSTDLEASKLPARVQTTPQNLHLLGQPLALDTDLLGLPSNASDLRGGHVVDSQGRQDAIQGRHELGLDHLDGHIVDEAPQGYLGWGNRKRAG